MKKENLIEKPIKVKQNLIEKPIKVKQNILLIQTNISSVENRLAQPDLCMKLLFIFRIILFKF